MNVYEICFSPTGGTGKVAEILAGVWPGEKKVIDLLDPETDGTGYRFCREDICIAAVPSFGGRVPAAALQKFANMQGGGARAVLIAVYGNRDFEDTLIELKDTLCAAGFVSVAAVAAVAEHSIFRQFGAGRPDERDQEELKGFAGQIAGKLNASGTPLELQVPGNHPYKEYNGIPLKPKGNKNCVECGICARECPVCAIPLEAPATVDRDKCISCMHCVAVCPHKARGNQKMLMAAAAQKIKKSCGGRKENRLFL